MCVCVRLARVLAVVSVSVCVCVCVCVCGRVVSTQRARPHSLNWSRARLGNAEGFADGFNEGFADSFADGVADSFADGDGDVRMRSVAPRRAATAAAAAGRAAPRSRAAELAFTNVKAYFTTCLFVGALMMINLRNPSTGRI